MKIKVTSEFVDKFNKQKTYHVGEVVEFEDARANDLIKRELAVSEEPIVEATEEAEKGNILETVSEEPPVAKKRGRKKSEE